MIYFDNSATSRFKPRQTLKAIRRELLHSANGGRSGHNDAVATAMKISDTRTLLCDYFNANEVIFTKNCTEALNIVVHGILKRGDHVITTVTEHNSTLRPLYNLQKNGICLFNT